MSLSKLCPDCGEPTTSEGPGWCDLHPIYDEGIPTSGRTFNRIGVLVNRVFYFDVESSPHDAVEAINAGDWLSVKPSICAALADGGDIVDWEAWVDDDEG